jgi:hypothetical protein
VIGISIIGLGNARLRPTLTFTAAASTISVTAANCTIEGLVLYSTFTNGVTAGVTAGALADGFTMRNCEFEESANTTEFLIGISIAAACHHVTLDGVVFLGVDGGTDSSAVIFVGASDYSVVKNCIMYGDFSAAVIDSTTAASLYQTFTNNIITNIDTSAGLGISAHANTTGTMAYNNFTLLKNNVGPVGAAMGMVENLVTNALGVQGYSLPARDT